MPTPKKGESEKEFVGRCIPFMMHEHPDMKQDQAIAVCYSMFRESKKDEEIIKKIDTLLNEEDKMPV